MKHFSEWREEEGFGDTGDPEYPYHPRHGKDVYYPKKDRLDDERMEDLYQDAHKGIVALHEFFTARTMQTGDTGIMRAWSEVQKMLGQIMGGEGSKKTPYRR